MTKFLARVRVVLTAAPTYITTVAMVATVASEEIARAFPAAAEPVGRVAVVVAAVAGAAVAIIRRVTPVLPAARGLLPAEQRHQA